MAKMVKSFEAVTGTKTDPKTEPRFKAKKGSVFPAKRRLVKSLMLDQFVKCIAPPFGSRPCCETSCFSFKMASKPKSSNEGKRTEAVFPWSPQKA